MRGWILVAALMISGIAVAADTNTFQVRTANDLVRVCSLAPDDPLYPNAMGLCHGVLLGAWGYYDSTMSAENRFVCAPSPTPTRAAVMSGFVTWAESNSQYMNDVPVDALFRYLAATYPCAK
jgi:Rap1a immunity proteins